MKLLRKRKNYLGNVKVIDERTKDIIVKPLGANGSQNLQDAISKDTDNALTFDSQGKLKVSKQDVGDLPAVYNAKGERLW